MSASVRGAMTRMLLALLLLFVVARLLSIVKGGGRKTR